MSEKYGSNDSNLGNLLVRVDIIPISLALAQAAIESEKQAAVAELKQQVASLSIEIAEKVTKETLADNKKQSQLVQKLLKDVNL